MRIPPHWQRAEHQGPDRQGRVRRISALGWSFQSSREALAAAERNARKLFDIIVLQGRRPEQYEYNERTIREEILERYGAPGEEWALVTRNRYGAEVLNTTILFIADIDFPSRSLGFSGRNLAAWLRLLWPGARARRQEQQVTDTLAVMQTTLSQVGLRDYRIYRTPGGWRLLLTDRRYDPQAKTTLDLLEQLNSDPLYLLLVQKQACFRARLTPKPWRVRYSGPPVRYPLRDAAAADRFAAWLAGYRKACTGHRACALAVAAGRIPDPKLAHLVALHDQQACASHGEPLA